MEYEVALNDLEKLLRSGQHLVVRKKLSKWDISKVPRRFFVRIADVSRRAKKPSISLKVLYPIIRGDEFTQSAATDGELLEYAATLQSIGATREAYKILENLTSLENPRAYLYLGINHIKHWEYSQASSFFENYLKCEITDYQKLVGKVNLLSCFVYEERYKESEFLIDEMQEVLLKKEHLQIKATVLETQAQMLFKQSLFRETENCLHEAQKLLKGSGSQRLFFIQKWQILLQAKKNKNPKLIKNLRELAFGLRNWETVRDCDIHLASFNGDFNRLCHVYFGTPYKSLREKILIRYEKNISIPEEFLLKNEIESDYSGTSLSLIDGPVVDMGPTLYKLLLRLTLDFYRPVPLCHLHAEVYAGEHFDPYSSPNKVHQIIRRLRAWFKANGVPLGIEESRSFYKLIFLKPYAIRLSQNREQSCLENEKINPKLDLLQKLYGTNLFSAKQAREKLDIPLVTMSRIMKQLLEEGRVERVGRGPQTLYRLLK